MADGGTPPAAGSRGVTIGIRQAAGVYTFSGAVTPAEAGVQVTTARLDGVTKRVTGVASTRTDAAGRCTIRTRLPAGFAGYYSLTETRSGVNAGRSRLYGLVVPGEESGHRAHATPEACGAARRRNAASHDAPPGSSPAPEARREP